jgi:microcystin-dependent protein
MEGTIGEIRFFAGNFAPKAWAFCQGQIMPIQANTALFSILGTYYGGNGVNTFALPDFTGNFAIGAGQSSTGTFYDLGQIGGNGIGVILPQNFPSHTHSIGGSITLSCNQTVGNNDTAQNSYPGFISGTPMYVASTDGGIMGNMQITDASIGSVGNNQPFNIVQPLLGMNFIICLQGQFPSRN